MNYIFTNDEEYLTTKADLVFKQNSKTVDPKKVLVKELRNRVDLYYRILIRNLRDSIPKVIMISILVYWILFSEINIR